MKLKKIIDGFAYALYYTGIAFYWVFIGWWVKLIKYFKSKKESNSKSIEVNPFANKQYNNTTQDKFDDYTENQQLSCKKYNSKFLMTKNEQYFYNIINKAFSDKYLIMPQVNLASILNKKKQYQNEYQNELFRNIDFGIFDKETTAPLLLIEINDKSHNEKKRQYRDVKVKGILQNANIKLITFYTKFTNKEDYIINRIKENLK